MGPLGALAVGQRVYAFYRFEHNGSGELGGAYFPCIWGVELTPRVGASDSWQPAVVLSDWNPAAYSAEEARTWPRVRMCGGRWATRRGDSIDLDERDSSDYSYFHGSYRPEDLRTEPPPPPALSVLSLRWGPVGGRGDASGGGGGDTSGPAAAGATDERAAAFSAEVYRALGPAYEVVSCFVSRPSDLAAASSPALCAHLRAPDRSRFAVWWMEPGEWEEAVGAAGALQWRGLCGAAGRLAAAGVPTLLPAPPLVGALASEAWLPRLAAARAAGEFPVLVPAAVRVSRAAVARDAEAAAAGALRALAEVRRARQLARDRRLQSRQRAAGVVCTGFSSTWPAECSAAFDGELGLRKALEALVLHTSALAPESAVVREAVDAAAVVRAVVLHGKVAWVEAAASQQQDPTPGGLAALLGERCGACVAAQVERSAAALGAWLGGLAPAQAPPAAFLADFAVELAGGTAGGCRCAPGAPPCGAAAWLLGLAGAETAAAACSPRKRRRVDAAVLHAVLPRSTADPS